MTDNDSSTRVGAAPIPPVVSGSPEEVADGVFVIADRRVPLVPNIGVVVGESAALVVDTGMGPRNGVVVREAARELAGDRPLFLTLTHFHPEHGYGAQAFLEAATIIYNREQHDEFLQKARPYLDMFRGMGGGVAEQLEGVEFVDPHVVYEGAADLDLGGKVVRLRTWGPRIRVETRPSTCRTNAYCSPAIWSRTASSRSCRSSRPSTPTSTADGGSASSTSWSGSIPKSSFPATARSPTRASSRTSATT